MKICYRTWGFTRDDWACSIHPTSDWQTVDEDMFNAKKMQWLHLEGEEKSKTARIEWMPASEEKSRWLVRGWQELKP